MERLHRKRAFCPSRAIACQLDVPHNLTFACEDVPLTWKNASTLHKSLLYNPDRGKKTLNGHYYSEMSTFTDLAFFIYFYGRVFMAPSSFGRVNTPDELPAPSSKRCHRRLCPASHRRHRLRAHGARPQSKGYGRRCRCDHRHTLTYSAWEDEDSPTKSHEAVHQWTQIIPLIYRCLLSLQGLWEALGTVEDKNSVPESSTHSSKGRRRANN